MQKYIIFLKIFPYTEIYASKEQLYIVLSIIFERFLTDASRIFVSENFIISVTLSSEILK